MSSKDESNVTPLHPKDHETLARKLVDKLLDVPGGSDQLLKMLQRNANGVDRVTFSEAWADPVPLPTVETTVKPFIPLLLPDTIRPYVYDVTERMGGCPVDFIAVGTVISMATLLGRKIGVRPKRMDDWTEYPNLWGMVVSEPTKYKSPALSASVEPLKKISVAAQKQWRLMHRGKEPEDVPPMPRYTVNNATVESVHERLAENPNGLLLFRDELEGWLSSLRTKGKESDRAFYLECWSGSTNHVVDRIGRGTVSADLLLSILGGIQPGVLSRYVNAALGSGAGADGLLQRFQLLIWPDKHEYKWIDRKPDLTARKAAYDVFEYLDGLTPQSVGAEDDNGVHFLRFDEAARDMFKDWLLNLEDRIGSGEINSALAAHLSKYRKLCPALALLLQLSDKQTGPISDYYVEVAIEWCDYLESHASRVYMGAGDTVTIAAKAILERIKTGHLENQFTARIIKRCQWAGLKDSSTIDAALVMLVEHGYLWGQKVETGGRASVQYESNPLVYALNL